jgi:hypothetical protein
MRLFSKRALTQRLNPVRTDQGGWLRDYVRTTFVDGRRVQRPYTGSVLRSSPAAEHSLEFTCRPTVLRPARVRIPIFINSGVLARLSVNGEQARSMSFSAAAGDLTTFRVLTPYCPEIRSSDRIWPVPNESKRLYQNRNRHYDGQRRAL